jgi:hypothetical protein
MIDLLCRSSFFPSDITACQIQNVKYTSEGRKKAEQYLQHDYLWIYSDKRWELQYAGFLHF